jgi:hypothetical protein
MDDNADIVDVLDTAKQKLAKEWDWATGPSRADAPTLIERDAATGNVTREDWAKNGKLDRADGPATISRDAATGTTTFEGWAKNGLYDRADGPAVIRRDRHCHRRGMGQGRQGKPRRWPCGDRARRLDR